MNTRGPDSAEPCSSILSAELRFRFVRRSSGEQNTIHTEAAFGSFSTSWLLKKAETVVIRESHALLQGSFPSSPLLSTERATISVLALQYEVLGPIQTGRKGKQMEANGTYCCEWECSHWTQATSMNLPTNLRAGVQGGLDTSAVRPLLRLAPLSASGHFTFLRSRSFSSTLDQLTVEAGIAAAVSWS